MTEPPGEPRAGAGSEPEDGLGADAGAAAEAEADHRGEAAAVGARGVGLDDRDPDPTGDVRVDEAVALLASLDATPVTEHVAVYDEVHRRLQDTLATLDRG